MTKRDLLHRVRGEFGEMPGLRLTVSQACRLWQLDEATCYAVLDTLVAERFLHRTADGAYVAIPRLRPAAARGTLPGPHKRRA
jgi:DNA-binding IclR family transcriptional regulator